MRWILNIILNKVSTRRRILMLIFKYVHILSWACQVDNYMPWPMCLEFYPDRQTCFWISVMKTIKSHMSAVLLYIFVRPHLQNS
jgi:hypothetical protein